MSYSCTPNMAQIIKAHNSKITNKLTGNKKPCNCQNKQNCPLSGKCQTPDIVYLAEVSTNSGSKLYIGGTEDFKERYGNHKKSFNHRKYQTESELSKYIRRLKDARTEYEIRWSILRRTSGYSNISQSCSICTSEKLAICDFKDKDKLLNKRSELVSKCRHENKFLLKNFRSPNG